MEWDEYNIIVPDRASKIEFFLDIIEPILNKIKRISKTWHFLWEYKDGNEILRLRFQFRWYWLRLYARKKISNYLIENNIVFYTGCHGKKFILYNGEIDRWGTKGWELGIKILQFGSEISVQLMKDAQKIGNTEEYIHNPSYYADRYIHLFLNQIEPILIEVDHINEKQFMLQKTLFRYAVKRLFRKSENENFLIKHSNNIVNDIWKFVESEINRMIERKIEEIKT